jgi:hypothetical protein
MSKKRAKLLITTKKTETNGGEIIRTRHLCDASRRQTFRQAAAGTASDVSLIQQAGNYYCRAYMYLLQLISFFVIIIDNYRRHESW